MKLTKRMKNSIVQIAIANIFFLLILLAMFLLFTLPRVQAIEEKKTQLLSSYEKLQEISTEGIDFTDFKTAIRSSGISNDSYTSNLIRNISQDFYDKNFNNTGSTDYVAFLQTLEDRIQAEKTSDIYIEKDRRLNVVLPVYDENNNFSWDGLSDFFFINHIENLLYSFNLSARWEIGVGDLQRHDNTDSTDWSQDNLQENIYSIPLTLTITGQKKDIVDFIHYFESVWWINIDSGEFKVFRDNFISKTLEGADSIEDYNIYENQIADIVSISIPVYPDSSSRQTTGLIDAMKWQQAWQKMVIDVELAFYVAGIPGYKMERYVQSFLASYKTLSWDIATDAKKYTTQAYKFTEGTDLLAIKNIQSLDIIMWELEKNVKDISIAISKREDIQKTYESTIEFQEQLTKIDQSYKQQLKTLTR